MGDNIYILFSCNAWKEYSSMRVVFVGDSVDFLEEKIRNEIREGNMCYSSEDLSVEEQLALFDEEFDDNLLIYGFVDTYTNNDMNL